MQQVWIDPEGDGAAVDDWSDAVEDTFWPSDGGARETFYNKFPRLRVAFSTPTTINNAVTASISSNYGLVAIAVVVVCLFVVGVLFVRGRVFVRMLLGVLGILSVALSIGAGFGLALYIGLPFTTVTQVLPFLLLGIGVDDMFMLVRPWPCVFANFCISDVSM